VIEKEGEGGGRGKGLMYMRLQRGLGAYLGGEACIEQSIHRALRNTERLGRSE
jgi:hypothetical protein